MCVQHIYRLPDSPVLQHLGFISLTHTNLFIDLTGIPCRLVRRPRSRETGEYVLITTLGLDGYPSSCGLSVPPTRRDSVYTYIYGLLSGGVRQIQCLREQVLHQVRCKPEKVGVRWYGGGKGREEGTVVSHAS